MFMCAWRFSLSPKMSTIKNQREKYRNCWRAATSSAVAFFLSLFLLAVCPFDAFYVHIVTRRIMVRSLNWFCFLSPTSSVVRMTIDGVWMRFAVAQFDERASKQIRTHWIASTQSQEIQIWFIDTFVTMFVVCEQFEIERNERQVVVIIWKHLWNPIERRQRSTIFASSSMRRQIRNWSVAPFNGVKNKNRNKTKHERTRARTQFALLPSEHKMSIKILKIELERQIRNGWQCNFDDGNHSIKAKRNGKQKREKKNDDTFDAI